MIKTIIHQIWNERRQNMWLFLELVAVSIFLWLAIDPLYVLIDRSLIAPGYNADRLYMVKLNRYSKGNIKWQPDADNAASYRNAFDVVRLIPEIEAAGTTKRGHYPNGGSYSSTSFIIDSTLTVDGKEQQVSSWIYKTSMVEGDNLPATFGFIDARTGRIANIVHDENVQKIFITRGFAQRIFGSIDVIGIKLSVYGGQYVICGVLEDIQMIQYANYRDIAILVESTQEENFDIHFRLRKGVNEKEFERRFNEVYAPRLASGNLYCTGIVSYNENLDAMNEYNGYSNTYRMQAALTLFALMCAFLGVVSTFWIRANVRRRDIGVMRSVGASSMRIVWQFIVECTLLVSVAFAVALPLLLHKVYVMGFASPLQRLILQIEGSTNTYDVAWVHFLMVSVITYLIVLVVAIMGAAIPAKRIASVRPSDALREE